MICTSIRAVRYGLTLIELVVVLAIIAVLAVMVVPRLDFLKAQAEHSSSAGTQADLASVIQTFKASSNEYPSLDTLITTGGTLTSVEQYTAGYGLVATTIPEPGAPGTSDWYRSFTDGGFKYAYQHDTAATSVSDSGTVVVDLYDAVAEGSVKLAVLQNVGSNAKAVFSAIYPGGVTRTQPPGDDGEVGTSDDPAPVYTQVAAGQQPTTSKLVAFGIGPKSNMIGRVLASTPMSAMGSDNPDETYCRYLAIFEIFQDGSPAKFKMITDHRLRQISARINLYKQGNAAK
jgi:prepilin-type N-terminal cleavage/methylation domain-containing protein